MNNHIKPILFVGRIIESKGITNLIKAYYQAYLDLNFYNPLWIIGGNNVEIKKMQEHPDIKDIHKSLSNINQVFWWGHLPHDVLPYIIRQCLFSCFPSKYEPGGRTILEAMACGLPVIASPYGFAEEVVIPGNTGIIINTGSNQEWVDSIKYMIDNPDIASFMGENARELIQQKYNIEIFRKKHWEIYSEYQ